MRRREFITLIGGVALLPGRAAFGQSERVRHIGMLIGGAEADPETQARLTGFWQGLSAFGWTQNRNIQVDYRYAGANLERAQALAKELVAQKPDLIVAASTQIAVALKRETRVIPLVFVGAVDPVGSGLVASLARPGGNLTGAAINEESVAGKWLAMLKEIAPNTEHVAVLFGERNSFIAAYAPIAESAAKSLNVELVFKPFTNAGDMESALLAFASVPNGALLVPPDISAALHRDLIIALAAKHRLPAVYQARFWVAAGGLMSYGADRVAAYRQAAYYVDHILRGASPADLPVQAPTKYETTLNLKTAKTLGLTVPPGLLVAADEVIE